MSLQSKHTNLFIIVIIMIGGFFLRVEDYSVWKKDNVRMFYEGEPLLTNLDGYYYLRIAKDLVNNNYSTKDSLRGIPDSLERPYPPPLLSSLTAFLNLVTGISIHWISVFLPPLLGVLLVIPVFLIGLELGGKIMAFHAAALSMVSTIYFTRTAIGWYDTDCLNVTFILLGSYLAYKYYQAKTYTKQSLIYLFLIFFNGILFYYWWDMASYLVILLSFSPLLLALILKHYKQRSFWILFSTLLIVILLFSAIKVNFFESIGILVKTKFSYLFAITNSEYPVVSRLVSEQADSSLMDSVMLLFDSLPLFFFSLLGLLLLMWQKKNQILFYTLPFILALLGLLFAKRYLIFTGPISALGLAYISYLLWKKKHLYRFIPLLTSIFIALSLIIPFATNLKSERWASYSKDSIVAYKKIREATEENSLIWNWWDYGHPLIYWSERLALSDGANHKGRLSVYSTIPLVSSSPQFAANFINFFTVNGYAGFDKINALFADHPLSELFIFNKIFSKGPEGAKTFLQTSIQTDDYSLETLLQLLFPAESRPVYFFLDYRLAKVAYWWYWLGTWDTIKRTGIHSKYIPYYRVVSNNQQITNNENILIPLDKGTALLPSTTKNLVSISLYDNNNLLDEIVYDHQAQAYFEMYLPGKYGALMRDDIRNSLYNKLFIRHIDTPYFQPIILKTPLFQLYRVVPDVYQPSST